MQLPWHAWRRRRRKRYEEPPFASRQALAKFLGATAAACFNGDLSEKRVHAIERLTVDFLKVLAVHDFHFELQDALQPSKSDENSERGRYS